MYSLSVYGAAQKDKENIEEVISIAKRVPEDASTVRHSISYFDQEQLQFVSQNHIQEVFLRVPGVNLHRGNGQEYLPAIRSPVLTGAGACGAIMFAEDSIPLRAAGFCNVNELFEAHTEQAAQIEIQRGPGSALYGSNALHGLVNVVTVNTNAPDSMRFGVETGANEYARLKLATTQTSGHRRWGGKITLTHDGGYRDDAGYDQQKFSFYHAHQSDQLDITTGLSLTNLNQETAGFITGENAYRSKRLAQSNPNPEAYRDASALRLWSRLDYQQSENANWVITPYLRYTNMDFLQHFLPGDPLEENGQGSVGMQTAYYHQATDQLRLILGLDAEYTAARLQQTQELPTQGSAFLVETVPLGLHYNYQVNAAMLASFATLEWSPTIKWNVSAGLRLEHMAYDYDNRMLSGRTREDGSSCGFGGCRYSRPDDRRDSFTMLSPKFGISYQLAQLHRLYANISHGFRAPQATELYRLQRDQQVANLNSEQAQSVELGFRGQAGTWRYELAFYHMRKDNVIFRDSDFFNRDNGRTEHQGIELGFQYQINAAFDVAGNMSLARHRYDYDQVLGGVNINANDMDTAPRHFGSLRLGWGISSDIRAELEWVNMGKYYLEPENQYRYQGHELMNLRFAWQVNDSWRLHARLLNVADTRYAERADFTSFAQERYFPGEPRSIFVGIEKTWD